MGWGGVWVPKMKHLGLVNYEKRREFAGTSERLSICVPVGCNFCPAMSLLIQTKVHGLCLEMESSNPGLAGFRTAW